MVTRREWLGITVGSGAALAFGCREQRSAQAPGADIRMPDDLAQLPLIRRTIPSSSEQVPLVGLGSSATFQGAAREDDHAALGAVLQTLVNHGGSVFDTAPAYGRSEEVAGAIAEELGIADDIFWATKVNVARGGVADPAAAREQLEQSFARLRRETVDLIQVHQALDVPVHLRILEELKREGRVRHIGVSLTSTGRPGDLDRRRHLEQVMQSEPLDFIGIDYAINNRYAEETILPLALERKIGVLVYQPFGRPRLWQRIGEQPVPEFAAEFDVTSWAQLLIKFIAAHPAVTCITPATSQERHMVDNLGAARGRLPDELMRTRMIEAVEALPRVPGA